MLGGGTLVRDSGEGVWEKTMSLQRQRGDKSFKICVDGGVFKLERDRILPIVFWVRIEFRYKDYSREKKNHCCIDKT